MNFSNLSVSRGKTDEGQSEMDVRGREEEKINVEKGER